MIGQTHKTERLPLSEKEYTGWKTAIEQSRKRRKAIAEEYGWDENLKRYKPSRKGRRRKDINLGLEFSDTERKKAALWFEQANVALTDAPPELAQAVVIHQELLNELLGPNHADAHTAALKAIFNCLCPSGVGPTLVGYHCTKVEVDAPVLDPMTGMPVMDPATLKPVTQKVPVPIAEKWFVDGDISPKALLLPAELKTTDYRKAKWIGYEWQKPRSQVQREYKLPKDWTGHGAEGDKPYFEGEAGERGNEDAAGDPLISGVTLYYRAELAAKNGEVIHPDLVRILTLADGVEKPLEHRHSPDQELITDGPDAGRLTPDSIIGFNLRPLVLRDLTDEEYVPSDASMTAALSDEQAKYREMALRKRDTNVNVIAYEASLQDAVDEAKKQAGTGATIWVPVPDNSLATGAAKAAPLAQSVSQRETYQDQEILRQDRARVLGIDFNQTGVSANRKITATESSNVQRNTEARFEQERQRVRRWFLHDVVRPFDALVLRYCDQKMAVRVLGPQKGQLWFQAKEQLKGGYRYTLQMDSGKYLDVEQSRQQMLNVINFAAKAQNVNQKMLWLKFAEVFGYDPTQFVVDPPPPKPEVPKGFTVKAEDLNPMMPHYPNVYTILTAAGFHGLQPPMPVPMMQPMAPMGGQPEHGGPADKAERIDQHTAALTGKMPGNAAALS